MNCPECGNPVERDAQFCPKCYARIEPPGFWRRLFSIFQPSNKSGRSLITFKKSFSVKTTDPTGERHEYHSLDEMPVGLRAEIEKLQSEAMKDLGAAQDNIISQTPDGTTSKLISKKSVTVFRIKDASGKETVYHSLDEMPPELRAAIERVQDKMGGQST